jgi:hypothetical protein
MKKLNVPFFPPSSLARRGMGFLVSSSLRSRCFGGVGWSLGGEVPFSARAGEDPSSAPPEDLRLDIRTVRAAYFKAGEQADPALKDAMKELRSAPVQRRLRKKKH